VATSDVIELILSDHREVERLFATLENEDVPMAERERALKEVGTLLIAHSRGEEDVVYPAIRESAPDEDADVEDSVAEHDHVEELLEQLLGMPMDAPGADGLLAAMIGEVRHHVEEEQEDILPAFAQASDEETRAELGRRFRMRENQVLTERGHPRLAEEVAGGHLSDLSRDELYEKAKEAGLKGRSDMSKEELAEALRDT
jgi:hypothetical protein